MAFPTPLPGEFVIRTSLNFFLSGLYDPNSDTGTVITSTTTLGPNEKFKLTAYTPEFSLIQTLPDLHYVTVSPQGGLDLSEPILETSLFTLVGPIQGQGAFIIRTRDDSFLIAVDAGGHTSNAFTTAVTNNVGGVFWITKSGDLGNGYRYAIRAAPSQDPRATVTTQYFLTASGGGGLTAKGVTARESPLSSEGIFTLIRLPDDGSYALQTCDGFNYVTAVDGGGLAGGDNLHTDATRIQAWERFNIVDQGDATYTIQTVSGFFLAVATEEAPVGADISTRINSPDLAPQIGYTAKFEFIMLPNQLAPSDT